MSPIKKVIRRSFSRFPMAYEIGASLNLVRLKLTYSGGDAIAAISLLKADRGLALDIGANRGQSAVRILKLKPGFSVLSFEPNKQCFMPLRFAKLLLGSSFRYELYGLSDKSGEKTYYEPYIHALAVAAEGTFCPENLGRNVAGRIGPFAVRTSLYQTRTLDEMSLSPSFVKLDVQGGELDVLRGARETLSRCKPMIVVERNSHNEDDVKSYLADFDYAALDPQSRLCVQAKLGDLSGDNVFIVRSALSEMTGDA